MPIEQVAPEMERIVSLGQEVEWLGSGFGAFDEAGMIKGVAEGPVWWKEGGYVLFSDCGNNKRHKWAPGQEVSLYKEPTHNANGLTRDR